MPKYNIYDLFLRKQSVCHGIVLYTLYGIKVPYKSWVRQIILHNY